MGLRYMETASIRPQEPAVRGLSFPFPFQSLEAALLEHLDRFVPGEILRAISEPAYELVEFRHALSPKLLDLCN